MVKKNLYFAAPLFNEAELQFNSAFAERLRPFCNVFLPQRDGLLLSDLIQSGMRPSEARMKVFARDVSALNEADVLLIVLNGRTVDEGAAFELGYAFALGTECWGFKSDVRQLLPSGDNPMISGALRRFFCSVEDVVAHCATTCPVDQRQINPDDCGNNDTASLPLGEFGTEFSRRK